MYFESNSIEIFVSYFLEVTHTSATLVSNVLNGYSEDDERILFMKFPFYSYRKLGGIAFE